MNGIYLKTPEAWAGFGYACTQVNQDYTLAIQFGQASLKCLEVMSGVSNHSRCSTLLLLGLYDLCWSFSRLDLYKLFIHSHDIGSASGSFIASTYSLIAMILNKIISGFTLASIKEDLHKYRQEMLGWRGIVTETWTETEKLVSRIIGSDSSRGGVPTLAAPPISDRIIGGGGGGIGMGSTPIIKISQNFAQDLLLAEIMEDYLFGKSDSLKKRIKKYLSYPRTAEGTGLFIAECFWLSLAALSGSPIEPLPDSDIPGLGPLRIFAGLNGTEHLYKKHLIEAELVNMSPRKIIFSSV